MSDNFVFKDRVVIFPNGAHAFATKAKADAIMVEEDGAIYTFSLGDKEWKGHPEGEEEVIPPAKKPRKKAPSGNGASTH